MYSINISLIENDRLINRETNTAVIHQIQQVATCRAYAKIVKYSITGSSAKVSEGNKEGNCSEYYT